MISHTQLIDLQDEIDDVIPPNDTLSQACYNTVKLEYLFPQTDAPDAETASDEADGAMEQDNIHQLQPVNDAGNDNSDQTNWKLLRVIAGAHQGWVRTVAVDQVTNKWFATGSSDALIKVWDLASLKVKANIPGHIMGVRSLAISTRSPYLFSGSEDKTVRCWDLERTNSPSGCQIRNYHGHVGGIYAMALHPELDLLFTGGRDQVVRVWDIRSRTQVMVLTGHRSDITSIVSQVGDPQIVSSSMDSTIRLWDLRKQETSLTITQHNKSIRLMIMHPAESTICSGDSNGNIKQWVLPEGQLLNEFSNMENDIINTLAINPANNNLFAGYDDGKMEFYDYTSGGLLQKNQSTVVQATEPSTIYASTFDMSGLRLITCEGDKSIKIWGDD